LAAVVLLAWAAYVALPWWAPTEWIARRIEHDLSEQLGVPVRIASLGITWERGVEVHGLTIDSPGEFGPEPLVHVHSIRTDLSPIGFFVNRRLEWMEIDQPQVQVRTTADGRSNLEPLRGLRMDVTAGHIAVRGGRVAVRVANASRALALRIHDLQAELGPEGQLGPVSLSAAVEQPGSAGDATVSLSRGRQGASVAAAASVRFSNLDLAELPLAADGPLKELLGRLAGRLDVQVSRQGVVEAFGLELDVRRLEVWPARGEKWPAIDEASLRMSAAYDQINEALEVRSASLSLPGAELRGEAKVYLQALAGHVEAVERLGLAGRVYPSRLAKMLLGGESLGGGVKVTGPVDLSLHARREGAKTLLNLSLDANAASIAHIADVLKPAGRVGRLRLEGALHHQPRRLVVEEVATEIGGNTFVGRGAMDDLGLLARRLAGLEGRASSRPATGPPSGHDEAWPSTLAQLASLGWTGSCEIRDAAAMADLLPATAGPWRAAELEGVIRGRLHVERVHGARVRGGIQVSPDSRLTVPGLIAKAPGAPLTLDAEALVEPDGRTVRNVEVDVAAGKAQLRVRRGEIRLAAETLETTCALAVDNVRALREVFPPAAEAADVAGGNVSAAVSGRLTPYGMDANASADLRETALGVRAWWRKAAGEPATARVTVRVSNADIPARDLGDSTHLPASAGRSGVLALSASYQAPNGTIQLRSTSPLGAATGAAPADVEVDVAVDAGWLTASVPALAAHVKDARLSGVLRAKAGGRVGGDRVDANVFVDAGGAAYVDAARCKAAGVPLTMRVKASAKRDGGVLVTRGGSGELTFGASEARVSGRLELAPREGGASDDLSAGSMRLNVQGAVMLDDALRAALPELDAVAKRHGIEGRATLDANVTAHGRDLRVRVRVDGKEIAIANALDANALPPDWPAQFRRVTKPAGVAATVDAKILVEDAAAVRWGPDGSHAIKVEVENFGLRVGDAELTAAGRGAIRDGAIAGFTGRAGATFARAESLPTLMPGLAQYKPQGKVSLEAELADADGLALGCASADLGKLSFDYNGRRVFVNGRVDANGWHGRLARPSRGRPGLAIAGSDRNITGQTPVPQSPAVAVSTFRTDCLEFRAGDNHGWLIADVAGLAGKPKGTFHFLAERLDDKDLGDWLAGPEPNEPNVPYYRLSAARTVEVAAAGKRAAELLRRCLAGAELSGRVSVGLLRSWDKTVRCYYEVRQLELSAEAAEGRVAVEYRGGLNGGGKHDRYRFALGEADPNVSIEADLDEVLAEENFHPQLAKFFPGNTVEGHFSRRLRASAPLSRCLAAAIDSRYPLRAEGESRSVAVEGVTQGRSAPEWMAKIFPGLSLTKYHYRKMNAFAKHRADGSTANDMVFDGKDYDLFMEGTTDANSIGRYQIGLILLGSPQTPEWNHRFKQGRVPLLNFQARIEGGEMSDEHVSYPYPNETLFTIFLKNSIVYRMWLEGGKKSGKQDSASGGLGTWR
jgi:hypothetical protein